MLQINMIIMIFPSKVVFGNRKRRVGFGNKKHFMKKWRAGM
jgi:hypothetical protein